MTTHARRAILALPLLALARPALAALTDAEAEVVAAVEGYLNGISTLRSRFSQVNPDGSTAHGQLFLDRSQGMRLDYDPPSKILLIATDWRVIYYDGSIKQVNVIPISETPLGFLLNPKIRLSGGITVTGVRQREGEVDVGLVPTSNADQGSIVLTLARRPMELRRWIVTDAQRLETAVLLEGIETGMPLERRLFVWRDPKVAGWPED